jgi:ubiquinone/menaquinone biosynthesis C-methylase UbiE
MCEENATWDKEQAESYGRWIGLGSRLFYAPFARQIVRLLPSVEGGSVIVDLGTGPGQLSIELCKLVPQATLIGIDPSAEMLEVARRNAHRAGVSNFETRLGRAEQLPMRSGSAGVVVSQSSFHEWDDRRKGLSEILRVLEHGGHLFVKDYNRTWLSPWKRAVFGRIHPLDMFRFSSGEAGDFMRDAGFVDIEGEEGGLQFLVRARKTTEEGYRLDDGE